MWPLMVFVGCGAFVGGDSGTTHRNHETDKGPWEPSAFKKGRRDTIHKV